MRFDRRLSHRPVPGRKIADARRGGPFGVTNAAEAASEDDESMPLAKSTMTTGRVTYLGRTTADPHDVEPPHPPIRTGDRFRQVRPSGHVLSVARVVHPRSGRPHAWLRFVDGSDRAGTHMFVSLEALRDRRDFVRVSSSERESYGRIAAFSAGSPR